MGETNIGCQEASFNGVCELIHTFGKQCEGQERKRRIHPPGCNRSLADQVIQLLPEVEGSNVSQALTERNYENKHNRMQRLQRRTGKRA